MGKRALAVISPASSYASRFEKLEALPAYWEGRALGRAQMANTMDLSRDVLADHQAIAVYEKRAEECRV